MGLNLKRDYYRFTSVLSLIKLRSYGRLVLPVMLLAGMTLTFPVGTARSYVMHDEPIIFDKAKNVPRGTFIPFDQINDVTETINIAHKAKVSAHSIKSSSIAGNACAYLLNTPNKSSSKVPAIRTQRSVGKVAALGILLGARFVLTPKQHNKHVNIDHSSDSLLECQNMVTADNNLASPRSVKDVVAYRQRMKEIALARLN